MLSILHPCAKLKMPTRAAAVRVCGSAQSPVAAEAAPPSRPTRPRTAPFGVTLCPWSMGPLLGLNLLPASLWLPSPLVHGRWPWPVGPGWALLVREEA